MIFNGQTENASWSIKKKISDVLFNIEVLPNHNEVSNKKYKGKTIKFVVGLRTIYTRLCFSSCWHAHASQSSTFVPSFLPFRYDPLAFLDEVISDLCTIYALFMHHLCIA